MDDNDSDDVAVRFKNPNFEDNRLPGPRPTPAGNLDKTAAGKGVDTLGNESRSANPFPNPNFER